MSELEKQPIYRVIFMQHEKIYEVYARYLTEESLMGFIEIEELIFQDTKSELLIDPAEEKLSAEFKGVKRCYIPLHTILRIDEMAKEGQSRVTDSDKSEKKTSNVSHLPFNK